jgi:hypothetical protein
VGSFIYAMVLLPAGRHRDGRRIALGIPSRCKAPSTAINASSHVLDVLVKSR